MALKFKKALYLTVLVCLIVFAVGCKIKNSAAGSSPSTGCQPPFTIPARDSYVHYLEFMAVGDAGAGDDNQRSVAQSMQL